MKPNVTMLDLVNAVAQDAGSEAELVATVIYMVNSGHVKLAGNFAGSSFDLSEPLVHSVAA